MVATQMVVFKVIHARNLVVNVNVKKMSSADSVLNVNQAILASPTVKNVIARVVTVTTLQVNAFVHPMSKKVHAVFA